MKRLNLKATLICAAVAMTLKVLNHYSSYLPSETWLQDDFVMYWGLWNCAMFVFYLITMILLGFALYQHRNELPTLTPALKRQAQILVSLLGVYIICYLVITFVENVFGQETIPSICWKLYGWFFWIVIIFFVAWLWQFALVRREKMASEPIGKLGRGFAWFVIIGIIVYLATIVVTVALLPGYESQLMRILPEVIATTLLVWYIILLGSYIRYSDKALKQPTSDQLSNPQ
jgi:hypothetical protein